MNEMLHAEPPLPFMAQLIRQRKRCLYSTWLAHTSHVPLTFPRKHTSRGLIVLRRPQCKAHHRQRSLHINVKVHHQGLAKEQEKCRR